ncbi:Uncharacterised protein [uncultured archaeon]|nr:Uncharacterised protein [uncultured archaeon]
MRKAITPIIATVLLILRTVISVAASFIWITGVNSVLEERTGSETESVVSSCSRINLISSRGDQIAIENTGCDKISKINVIIDGVLTEYNLDVPLSPGEAGVITLDSMEEGKSHLVEMVLDNSQITSVPFTASQSSFQAGFCSNTCGDGVCCHSYGESWSTCVSDCIIKTYPFDQNGIIYNYRLFNTGTGSVLGGRVPFYTTTDDNNPSHKFQMASDKTAFNVFSQGMPQGIYYSIYYDGLWSQVARLTPDDGTSYEVKEMSNSDIRELVYVAYEQCIDSFYNNCTLYMRALSRNNGFSSPVTLNENQEFHVNGVRIGLSNNGLHGIIVWDDHVNSNALNYSILIDGAWYGPITITDNYYYNIVSASANNKGQYVVVYSDIQPADDTYHFFYYDGSAWNNMNITEQGYPSTAASIGDSFIFTISDSFGVSDNNYVSRNFTDGVFGPVVTQSKRPNGFLLSWGGSSFSKNKYDETYSLQISTTDGAYVLFLNGTKWDPLLNITWCTSFGCEEYEACNNDCAVETWCNDGVDNDEDGLTDSADILDCP